MAETLEEYMEAFLEAQKTLRYSEYTLNSRRDFLTVFCRWAVERSAYYPSDVTRAYVESYQRHLGRYRNARTKKPLSGRTQTLHLTALKMFFKWLTKKRHILYNPASELEMPRVEHKLPSPTLTVNEVGRVMATVDLTCLLGVRDRAVLEVIYSTGIRRMEICNLCLQDIDREKGVLHIRQGKGKRDRYVPIGDRALRWMDRYIEDLRPGLLAGEDNYHVFLNVDGRPMEKAYLSERVRRILKASGVGKLGGCHLLRHTAATLMYENGADIRLVKEFLGHASISTTQIYTRVGIGHLKEVHTRTHPAEKSKNNNIPLSGTPPPANAG